MVLLKNMQNSHRMGGKLEKKWLGPYEVVESLSKGRYTLKSSDGSILKKAYNGVLLKEYLQPFVVGIFTCRFTCRNEDYVSCGHAEYYNLLFFTIWVNLQVDKTLSKRCIKQNE